jgi:hypothetical protein
MRKTLEIEHRELTHRQRKCLQRAVEELRSAVACCNRTIEELAQAGHGVSLCHTWSQNVAMSGGRLQAVLTAAQQKFGSAIDAN